MDTNSTSGSLAGDSEATDGIAEDLGAGKSIKSGETDSEGEKGGVVTGVTQRLEGEEEEERVTLSSLGDEGAEF